MARLLLDTHIWAWSLTGDVRLTQRLQDLITAADLVYVSAISVYEIRQKVRLEKWADMAPLAQDLPELIAGQGAQPLAISPEIAACAAGLDWAHRDPFDRLLAGSAIVSDMKLVSLDKTFDTLADWPGRVGG